MGRFKDYLPSCLFLMAFLLALVITLNQQWFHGGYEGLLFKATQPILSGEAVAIQGQVVLTPQEDDVLASIMSMTFTFQGFIEPEEEKAEVSIEALSPQGNEAVTIATLIRDGESLVVVPVNKERDPIDFSGLLTGEEASGQDLWEAIYPKLQIKETEAMDRRNGMGHLPRSMVVYELDLMDLMTEEDLDLLGEVLGMHVHGLRLDLTFLVDYSGQLSSIGFDAKAGTISLEGWLVAQ